MDWFKGKNSDDKNDAVVDIAERKAQAAFAPLGQIEGYWNALRGTRPMPLRSEVDPRGLKGALEYCFVLERIAPGLARMRVAGSHMGDLMGMEVRGMPISSFLMPNARQEFGEMLEEVFETPATATVHLRAETSFGRPPMAGRMVLMPVRSDLGDTSRILGGFVTDGTLGRVPRRFSVDKIDLNRIVARNMPAPITPHNLPADAFRTAEQKPVSKPVENTPTTRGFEEGVELFEPAVRGVPYLRVVK